MDIDVKINLIPKPKLTDLDQLYLTAIAEAIKLQCEKSEDYNRGGVTREFYYLFGEETLVSEIWKKTCRLASLYKKELDIEPENEPLEDTLLDLINYAAHLLSYRRYRKIKGR